MFDPRQQVILLFGVDRSGEWSAWYEWAVPMPMTTEAVSQAELAGRLARAAASRSRRPGAPNASDHRDYPGAGDVEPTAPAEMWAVDDALTTVLGLS